MTDSTLDNILASCEEVNPRRYDKEHSTPDEIEMLRKRVFEFEPGIIYWYETKYQTPWSADVMWRRRDEVGARMPSFVVIVDLSGASPPDGKARKFLKQVAADPKVSYFAVFTEKNALINVVARFVFSSVIPAGNFILIKDRSEAIEIARKMATQKQSW